MVIAWLHSAQSDTNSLWSLHLVELHHLSQCQSPPLRKYNLLQAQLWLTRVCIRWIFRLAMDRHQVYGFRVPLPHTLTLILVNLRQSLFLVLLVSQCKLVALRLHQPTYGTTVYQTLRRFFIAVLWLGPTRRPPILPLTLTHWWVESLYWLFL